MNAYPGAKPELSKGLAKGIGAKFGSFTKFIGDGSRFARNEEQNSILSSDQEGSQVSDGPKLGSASTMSPNEEEVE